MTKVFLSLFILFCLCSFALGADVTQGKCLHFDDKGDLITIEEYDTNFSKEFPYGRPTGTKSVFNAKKAKIGITPKPGDILRIAFITKGNEKVAIRVMNVSRQDLMKK